MQNLLIDLDREMAFTRRLLERYPIGKGAWQPHDKSRTLSALATHVANIPDHGVHVELVEKPCHVSWPTTDVANLTARPRLLGKAVRSSRSKGLYCSSSNK